MLPRLSALLLCSSFAIRTFAQDSAADNRLNIHFQTTYIYQIKPSFHSAYQGSRSLSGNKENQNSLTATLYLGARLWKGAEVYFNPEMAAGSGLSGAQGMGGSTNGETFRVGNPAPTLYNARLFFAQTFSLGKENEKLDDDINQVSMSRSKDYIKLMAGKFSVADVFDINEYSNSPRTQFLNWSLMNNGAWDFAANVRGYTYAIGAVAQYKNMSYRLALASLPKTANGDQLETDISKSMAINAELGRAFTIKNRPLNIRVLGFYNKAPMGNYEQAYTTAVIPDVTATRKEGRGKYGIGLNGDWEINDFAGVFGRLGWNDGSNETWCFTEIDRTASLGLSLDGKKWNRAKDQAGIAFVANGLSQQHQTYLQKGGSGFVLGDGNLRYGTESIAELYYSMQPAKIPLVFTADYQFCMNPGYNKDRGPASVFSFRMHLQL